MATWDEPSAECPRHKPMLGLIDFLHQVLRPKGLSDGPRRADKAAAITIDGTLLDRMPEPRSTS